jgi:hypothetical protein
VVLKPTAEVLSVWVRAWRGIRRSLSRITWAWPVGSRRAGRYGRRIRMRRSGSGIGGTASGRMVGRPGSLRGGAAGRGHMRLRCVGRRFVPGAAVLCECEGEGGKAERAQQNCVSKPSGAPFSNRHTTAGRIKASGRVVESLCAKPRHGVSFLKERRFSLDPKFAAIALLSSPLDCRSRHLNPHPASSTAD